MNVRGPVKRGVSESRPAGGGSGACSLPADPRVDVEARGLERVGAIVARREQRDPDEDPRLVSSPKMIGSLEYRPRVAMSTTITTLERAMEAAAASGGGRRHRSAAMIGTNSAPVRRS